MSIKNEIFTYTVEGQSSKTTEVTLSDGKTRVQTLGFSDGSAGICIVRDNTHVKPYSKFNHRELDRNTYDVDSDKIVIKADNVRSIDVIIKRLEEAKLFIQELKQ